MNGLIRTGLIVLGATFFLATPVTADVYMWRDADGTVHYGDKPGSEDAKKLDIETGQTDRATVARRYEQRQTARTESNAAIAERRASAEQQAADAAAQREQKAARCEEARERLASYINSRRLYRLDENGERQYLDDAEIAEARAKAEEAVNENCN
ncbi:DUF4124 domain-containing protein [Lentisalinibacter orientalis]|uniref:DUF4124 domain-containing protein n=1 Tax=Lentisalinibacter orientalis TaxID=2992241 RepID=UPI0038687BCA